MMRSVILACLCSMIIIACNVQDGKLVVFSVVEVPSDSGKKVGIRGSQFPLSWDKTILLDEVDGKYTATILFPDEFSGEVEFKYVLVDDTENDITWEGIENRVVSVNTGKVELDDRWDRKTPIDLTTLDLLQPASLQQDYAVVENLVRNVIPGTYRYSSEEEIEKGLAVFKKALQSPISYKDMYVELNRLLALIKCDHTMAGGFNQGNIINSIIHDQADKIPFSFKWIDGKMIVVYDVSEAGMPRGTEIIEMGGLPIEKVFDTLYPFIPADGNQPQNRIRKMEVTGYDFRYNAFDILYGLLFPSVKGIQTIKYREPKSETIKNSEITLLTREDRTSKIYAQFPDFPTSKDEMWNIEFTEDNIAVMTINSYGLLGWKAMQLDYKAWLSEAFSMIKTNKTQGLILDIRENMGGNDEMKIELFSYLKDRPQVARKVGREGRTRYDVFPETLKPFISTWGDDPWYYDLREEADGEEEGYFVFKEDQVSQPTWKKDVYNGETVLLTSGKNTSLAFYTAQEFRLYKKGIIIGEETGGNMRGINGGQILFLTLPTSGIVINAPVMGAFSLKPSDDTGIIPDVKTELTVEDIVNRRDLTLEAGLAHLRGK